MRDAYCVSRIAAAILTQRSIFTEQMVTLFHIFHVIIELQAPFQPRAGWNPDREDDFLLLGLSVKLRLLLICHCYRAEDSIIRIISARTASKKEAKYYQR